MRLMLAGWLATRRAEGRLPTTLNPEVVGEARRQALVTASPTDEHAAAMLLEAAGGVVDELVIGPAGVITDVRERLTRGQLLQLSLHRGLLLLGSAALALVFLRDIGGFIADLFGVGDEQTARRGVVGVAVCGVFLAATRTVAGAALAFGHKPPEWLTRAETIGTVIAGILAAAVT